MSVGDGRGVRARHREATPRRSMDPPRSSLHPKPRSVDAPTRQLATQVPSSPCWEARSLIFPSAMAQPTKPSVQGDGSVGVNHSGGRCRREIRIKGVACSCLSRSRDGSLAFSCPRNSALLAGLGVSDGLLRSLVLDYALPHQKGPALLRRRLSGGPTAEKNKTQKIIMVFATIGFIALLVVPALDHRFQWSNVPLSVVIGGDTLTALGFYIIFLVYKNKENSFASATIEVASDQRVISTGPYAIVRHPMYAGGLIYLLGMPFCAGLVLGADRAGSHGSVPDMATLR